MWDKEEAQNISRKKMKRISFAINFNLNEVCLSYIIYCLLFYFLTILTSFPTPRQICDIYLTRRKEFRKYWSQGFESEEDKDTDEWWRIKLLINGFN